MCLHVTDRLRLDARSQMLRMGIGMPRLLKRLRPRLAHFQHVVAPRCPCPAVVTIHGSTRGETALFRLTQFAWRTLAHGWFARATIFEAPRSTSPPYRLC